MERKFQGNFKGVSKKIEGQFQRHSKEVSRAFKESVQFQIKCQGCFKNVSMKVCFVILLFHGTHHSYPSRRMACCKDDSDIFHPFSSPVGKSYPLPILVFCKFNNPTSWDRIIGVQKGVQSKSKNKFE